MTDASVISGRDERARHRTAMDGALFSLYL